MYAWCFIVIIPDQHVSFKFCFALYSLLVNFTNTIAKRLYIFISYRPIIIKSLKLHLHNRKTSKSIKVANKGLSKPIKKLLTRIQCVYSVHSGGDLQEFSIIYSGTLLIDFAWVDF